MRLWAPPSVPGTARARSRELAGRLRERFGLNGLEAEFVVLVGRNGGLCLTGQVEAWCDRRGLPATQRRAIKWIHGLHEKLGAAFAIFPLEREGAHSVRVHQFVGRKLYREPGMEASRWRRAAERWSTPADIKRRLVSVGAVVARWWYPWLGSAEASVAWCDALGIDRAVLPQSRYRFGGQASRIYFPDRAPHAADESLYLFVCPLAVEDGDENESFGNWWRSYSPMWGGLARAGVRTAVVVARSAQPLSVPVAEPLRDWGSVRQELPSGPGIWFDAQLDYVLAGSTPAALEGGGGREDAQPGVATRRWRSELERESLRLPRTLELGSDKGA